MVCIRIASSSRFLPETGFLEMSCFEKGAERARQESGTEALGLRRIQSPADPRGKFGLKEMIQVIPQSDWIKKNAKSGAARNEEYYGKVVKLQ